MSTDNTVYIVDDDAAVRDALGLLLSLNGYRTAFFADAEAFLQGWSPALRGCMLLDIRMPGMDGLTLQKTLRERGCRLPVLVITGHGDVDGGLCPAPRQPDTARKRSDGTGGGRAP